MSKHPRLAVSEFMFPIDTSKSISHALACLPSTKIWEHLQKHLPQGHILSGCNVIYKTPTALCICSITMLVTVNVIWSSWVRWEQVEMELHWKCCQTSVMRAGWQKKAKSGKFWVCGKAIQNMCIKDELKAYLVPVLPPIYICVPLIAENKCLANKVGCT